MDRATSHLVHYTSSIEVVRSILDTGFLFIPNKRYLINSLLGEELFSDREPQEFGMVSFTQLPLDRATGHRERFGTFGIVVSWEWALQAGAQRVIYLDEKGPIAEMFSWLFRFAKQELEKVTGAPIDRMTYENKALASFAKSTLWSRLLTLYEYIEPERNSAQVEWRIVNHLPQYHGAAERSQLIQEILSAAKLWKNLGNVPVTANDIHAFVAPRGAARELRKALPSDYHAVPILTYSQSLRLRKLFRLRENALKSFRSRERIIYVPQSLPEKSLLLRRNADTAYRLPLVARIEGGRLYQDELDVAASVLVQYRTTTGELCDLLIPLRDAMYLLNMLADIQHRSGLDPLNPIDAKNRPRDLIYGTLKTGFDPKRPAT